jgi:hypothetical protein
MRVEGFTPLGGRTGESAALASLLAHAGAVNPHTGQPFSEALCFGIAGGIGAGYSFCPSVPRYGGGSGVSIVGRYQTYATNASWYQGFCDRLGIDMHITETGGPGKAYQNLVAELRAGLPTVVWCSRARLPFLGNPQESHDLWMHSFVIYALDEAKGLAYGADRPPSPVTITLDALAAARNGVCSHKNRTLTMRPPNTLAPQKVAAAVRDAIRATTQELLQGKMKTFSLPGLEIWAKMITNDKNKDGWRVVFQDKLMYDALRDIFDSIETCSTGGGLYRTLYAEFLDEASKVTGKVALSELAGRYRVLGQQWTELAESALPDKVKPFKQTKELLRKKCWLYETKGMQAEKQTTEAAGKLRALTSEIRRAFPLDAGQTTALLEGLREQITELHQAEVAAAEGLRAAVA